MAYLYGLIQKEKIYRKVYILSNDGDCFFNQLPWIYFLNLNPTYNQAPFGRFYSYDIAEYQGDKIKKQLVDIFEDKIKLAFLKVFSGVKTLPKHKGVTIEKLIPLIAKLNFDP